MSAGRPLKRKHANRVTADDFGGLSPCPYRSRQALRQQASTSSAEGSALLPTEVAREAGTQCSELATVTQRGPTVTSADPFVQTASPPSTAPDRAGAGWQSNDDIGHRREMIQNIMKLLKRQDTSMPPEWQSKLPLIVKQLEVVLYRSAQSFATYSDTSTLKERLRLVALESSHKFRNRRNMQANTQREEANFSGHRNTVEGDEFLEEGHPCKKKRKAEIPPKNNFLGRSTSSEETSLRRPMHCVICTSNEKTHIALPCMHLSYCESCVEEFRARGVTSCPLCNEMGVTFKKVYF